MKFEIQHRFSGAVLFSVEADSLKLCVEAAVKRGAYLSGAYLSGSNLSKATLLEAYLSEAYLSGSDLSGANLSKATLLEADLSGANLSKATLLGADLSGAVYNGPAPATHDEAIANLDKVREIILDNKERLQMAMWHDSHEWRTRTCAEEAICGTSHCLAGWLQVCSTDDRVRQMEPHIAGYICAPVAAKMFYQDNQATLEWLRERKYAEEA